MSCGSVEPIKEVENTQPIAHDSSDTKKAPIKKATTTKSTTKTETKTEKPSTDETAKELDALFDEIAASK